MKKIIKQLVDQINTDAFYKTHVSVGVTVKAPLSDGSVPVTLKLRKNGILAYEQTHFSFEEAIQVLNALKFQLAYTILAA